MSAELERLEARLAQEDGLIVAYSGGADSALLAVVAHRVLGPRALAATAVSASLPSAERRDAKRFAREQGMAHVEVCTNELDNPDYVANDGDRCSHCKSAMFDELAPLARIMGARIALGTNVDDLGDHRPGQAAAAERGAVFPMVDVGLTKGHVRELSRELGLRTASKPSAACLASRVAYGDRVTPEILGRIERAEESLREVGLTGFRVRSHGDGSVARIEVQEQDLGRVIDHRIELGRRVVEAGFLFVSLDLAGFRSGNMNRLLSLTPVTR